MFLGYAPLLGEIFQLQPKACYAYDHEPSCNTQPLKDPLLWRVSLTEDSSFDHRSGLDDSREGELSTPEQDSLLSFSSGPAETRVPIL